MRRLLPLLFLCAAAYAQTAITGQQVVVSGSGTIFVFVASSITVIPNTIGAPVGGTVAFTALFNDNQGNTTPACTSSGWSSNNAPIATVNASTGVATAVSAGTATISCSQSSLTGNAALIVETAPNFTNPALPCAQPCPLTNATSGQAYTYQLAAGGGTPPYTFSLISGTLPNGLSLNTSGLISGVTSALTTTTFTINVCDSISACSPNLQVSITVTSATGAPQLPATWVNNLEYVGTTSNTINFPATGTGGSWTCTGVGTFGPYAADSTASVNQAIADAENCRNNGTGHLGTLINLPHGHKYSAAGGLVLVQTAGDALANTNFIIINSDTPLTTGQTVCSHGIQDNVAASTQPGIRNVLCDGTQMSYQLGTSITTVSGSFTLANGTNTNTSAYNDVASMYTIECTAASCSAVTTGVADANNIGPHHYAILNGEFRPKAGVSPASAIVKLGTQQETLLSQRASHIHGAYLYLHGDWTDAPMSGCPSSCTATGSPTGANYISNGFDFAACQNCSLAYSYIDRVLRPGSEGHAIYLGYFDQIKVVHNWSEGESMAFFAGGYQNLTLPSSVTFANDVEDRGNRYTYPYSWLLAFKAGFCINSKPCSGNSYVHKNAHEMKVGNRIVDDGNIYENVDNTGAQAGIAASWKTAGLEGFYWLLQQNLTSTNSIVRNTCQGFSWGARSQTNNSDHGPLTLPVKFALFSNNLTYGVSLQNPGCSSVSPEMGFRLNNAGAETWDASITRDATGTIATATLTSGLGKEQSLFSIGDPVAVYGCTDATFNTNGTVLGPPALPGTLTNGLTVVYANSGTPNASSPTGCTVSAGQGLPSYLMHTHNSDFLFNTSVTPTDPFFTMNPGTPYPVDIGFTFTSDIFVNGGIGSSSAEGTKTQNKAMDTNSEVLHDDVFAGRTISLYTQYSDTHLPSTPTTLYGPTAFCTGNDPTVGGCLGILGGMSQSSFPNILNDWHNYRLCTAADVACNNKASLYAAGQANQAPDGTDLGVNMSAIDAAQTSNQYSGGYPDH
jgi:hypothetical protein